MRRKLLHKGIGTLLLLAAALPLLSQQKKEDEKVLLISAKSAQLIEKNGQNYRKVIGPAKFFHNNTYLLCDTALWNVNTNVIDAVGHVRIIQDRTQLSSATLQYVVDDNLARFRGDLVQLEDQDKNTLRTRYLDYNTKDSVAVFQNGAAMRDKDGQIIESVYGTYDSKEKLFVFNDQVNMYMDTTFVKTSRLEYRSDLSTAYFGFGTDMWQDDKMLSANDGWYDREKELFFFRRDVHLLTEDQEIWADTLYYYRALNDVDMRGKVEVMDTTRNAYALAGRIEYTDSLSQVRMTREPAVMSVSEENDRRDTLYLGADVLLSRAIRYCDIPEAWIADAEKRLSDVAGDPVMEYRRKAAEEAAKAAEEAAAKNSAARPPEQGGRPPKTPDSSAGNAAESRGGKPSRSGDAPPAELPPAAVAPEDSLQTPAESLSLPPVPPADSLSLPPVSPADSLSLSLVPPSDSLSLPPFPPADSPDTPAALPPVGGESLPEPSDSLSAPADTLPPLDTTKVNFIWGSRRVRLFRRDIQLSSDSLQYTDLDSLVRVYQDPIFFNEGNRQYAADSIYMVIRNKRMEKAHLLSDAFITIQEDSRSFDQIRGTEMVAYFDSTSALTRFDALGGASTLFFLEEQDALATVNKVDAKMIYATFRDGDIERMYYYDNPRNDGYPTVQLPEEERQLKGFRWEPERRPASPLDVTTLVPRSSERTSYLARPHARFVQTDTYFPGYIKKVYRDIAIRDSLQVVRQRSEQWRKDSLARAEADSLAFVPDSLSLSDLPDSLSFPSDSLALSPDSLSVSADSLMAPEVLPPSDSLGAAAALVPEDPAAAERTRREAEKAAEKARKEAEKRAAREKKQAEREARWAEKDRIYEEKKAAKAQRKLDKERARKLKALRKLEKRAQKERRQYEKYLLREEEKLLKQQNKKK